MVLGGIMANGIWMVSEWYLNGIWMVFEWYFKLPLRLQLPLQKCANGIPLNTIEYHWVPLSTIGPFNGISAGLSGILNGNLRYHSIPLNDTLNTKYHKKNHSDTIQIPFKYHWPLYPLGPLNGIWMVYFYKGYQDRWSHLWLKYIYSYLNPSAVTRRSPY